MRADTGDDQSRRVAASIFVGLLYVALCHVSDWLTPNQAVGGVASILFLPAFVRLLGVLLAGWWSIAGLAVGAYFCLDYIPDPGDRLALAALLGAGGPLATMAAMRALGIGRRLAYLAPRQIWWLSVACAAGSSLAYNVGLSLAGLGAAPVAALAATFIGDVAGTWAVIYATKLALHAWWGLRRR